MWHSQIVIGDWLTLFQLGRSGRGSLGPHPTFFGEVLVWGCSNCFGLRLFKLFYLTYSPHYRLKAGLFYLLPDSFGILRSNFAWIFAKMPFSVVLEYTFSFWKFCKSFCTFELIIFQALFVFAHSLLNQGLLKNVSNVIDLYHNKKIEGWSI